MEQRIRLTAAECMAILKAAATHPDLRLAWYEHKSPAYIEVDAYALMTEPVDHHVYLGNLLRLPATKAARKYLTRKEGLSRTAKHFKRDRSRIYLGGPTKGQVRSHYGSKMSNGQAYQIQVALVMLARDYAESDHHHYLNSSWRSALSLIRKILGPNPDADAESISVAVGFVINSEPQADHY